MLFNKLNKIICASLLLVAVFAGGAVAKADSTHSQTLEIVKYGLTPGATAFTAKDTTNDGQKINNLPTDNQGNQLSPLAGIHYVVQEIRPTGSHIASLNPAADSYTKVGEPADIETNTSGIADLSLTDGVYLVSEQANPAAGLKTPAEPLVIDLPVWNDSNTATPDTVYIYPKSSVDKVGNTPPGAKSPPAGTTPTPNGTSNPASGVQGVLQKLLPHTGVASSLGMMLLGLAMLFFLIFFLKRRKSEEAEQEENQA